ncbi:MAG: deoxynucleoside kinase, partial [Gemmatimonadaceae bacterium]
LMTSAEWGLYRRLYAELLQSPAARPPRLLIYLHGPLDVILDRIATRGRPKEKDASIDYWTTLHARYEKWIAEFRNCPVLALDIRDYDLLADPNAIEEIAGRLRVELEGELPQTELWPAVSRRRVFA